VALIRSKGINYDDNANKEVEIYEKLFLLDNLVFFSSFLKAVE